jgi:acetylornithine deacetylase
VLAAINEAALVATLRRLISVASVGGTDAEWDVQEVAADELRALGLEVETWPINIGATEAHPAFPGAEVPRRRALGLTARLAGASAGPSLLLNGHVDVVPAGEEAAWRYGPWAGSVAGGRLYGRGACDMKGGVAAIIHVAGALARSGLRLPGSLYVQTVIGEEDGGLGAFAAGLRGPRCDGAIIAEPTSLRPVLAQAGALTFRLRVPGKAAHAAMRLEGHSALTAYLPLHQALLELEQARNSDVAHPLMRRLPLPYPINVGIVQAGNWASTVPEQLVADGRYGVALGEPLGKARAALEQAIARAARRDAWLREQPPELTWWGGQFDSAEIEESHALVQAVAGALRDFGLPTDPAGVTWGSDMRLVQHVGQTPALLFGPGDVALAHQRDEYIELGELVQGAQLIALAALRFLGA